MTEPSRHGCFVAVVVAALLVVGCGPSGAKRVCRQYADASLCLRELNPGHYRPEASHLLPGSSVVVVMTGAGLPSGGARQTGAADDGGSFPPERGATVGLVVPKGSGGVTITITATSESGSRIEASFLRTR